jgi:DNA mismatch repair protein MutL
MPPEDAMLAFSRHATSKIASEADLEAIRTMGFRGEALASIAAVSRVRLLTARREAGSGVLIEMDGGSLTSAADAASPPGTTVEVRHLFFNTPARLKFLKSDPTEMSHIISAVSHQAMAHPRCRFRLTHQRKVVLDLPPADSVRERAFQVFGGDLSENLMEVSGSRAPAFVSGLIGKPNYSRADRTYQEFYVNGRPVRNAALNHAMYEAYRDLLTRDRHPAGLVFIELDPAFVDVNVHPAKAEVRFRNQSQIHDLVRDVIREALKGFHGNVAASRAEQVQDAAAEYLRNAEGKIPHAGFAGERSKTSLQVGKRDLPFSSGPGPGTVRPELRMPGSALLIPLAQVHDSFIIAQSNDGMALIDQHAAHERILFEQLQDQVDAGAMPVQNLLIPVQVEAGHAERELLAEYLPQLRSLGFHVEEFGGGTFVIRGVPSLLTGGDYQVLLRDILDELKVHGKNSQLDKRRDEVLSVMACHPAIKVHRKLSIPEMERLISDLFSCRMPHSCPHGRPTVVRFALEDLQRMFKRL